VSAKFSRRPETVRKIGESSNDTSPSTPNIDEATKLPEVPNTTDQAEVPRPVSAEPNTAEKPKLPDVTIASDQAMVPIASLGSPIPLEPGAETGWPPGEEPLLPKRYTYGKKSGDPQFGFTCEVIEWSDSTTHLNPILCSLVDSTGAPKYVQPADVSWTITLTQCPKAKILANVLVTGCDPPDYLNCSSYKPAARIGFKDVDIARCLADGSQLIVTLTSKATMTPATISLRLEELSSKGQVGK